MNFALHTMWSVITNFLILFLTVRETFGQSPQRTRREAYDFPAGTEILYEPLRATFQCTNDGYYADTDNNCQVFHVCHAITPGSSHFQQWSFLCGYGTIFNQLTMTCATQEEAIPCFASEDFFYLNDRIVNGDFRTYFLTDEDIRRADDIKKSFRQLHHARQHQGKFTKENPR